MKGQEKMDRMQEFLYENTPIRMIENNGETWWVLSDICKVLDLSTPSKVYDRLDLDEKGMTSIHTLGGKQNAAIVNESGLYSVILRSDKPEAKAFRRWITHEILPEIHRTGGYNAINAEILEDSSLTAASKTIFMYLCRCAKGRTEFVINRSKILNDLKMGSDMYANHINKLKKAGYISSEPCRNEKGRVCGIRFYINYPTRTIKNLENHDVLRIDSK